MKDETLDEQPDKPFRPITADDLFVLVKTIREYRKLIPKTDETAMLRYRAGRDEELLNKILHKGIDWLINYYVDQKQTAVVRMEIAEEMRCEDEKD